MKAKVLCTFVSIICAFSAHGQKYVGGDISLLTKYETNGAKYYTHSGEAISDVLTFFKSEGLNSMRVRLFVDPSKAPSTEKGEGVCQDIDFVKALGQRIKAKGMSFMLDIHYSDSWADPAKQYIPDAWKSLSDAELTEKVYDYTTEVLKTLNEAGATPDFIQTGNEISYGMLWGARTASASSMKKFYAGSSSNASRFFGFLKNAVKACREQCPQAKIVIHTERVANTNYTTQFYQDVEANAVDYDIIGMSYYPYFHGNLAQLEKTLAATEKAFPEKQIMIVEAGYPYAWEVPGTTYDYSGTYPYSDQGQLNFTNDLIEKLNTHPNVTGLYWWFMEANEYGLDWNTKRVTDKWYNAPLFDNNNGRATSALSVLKNFNPESNVRAMELDEDAAEAKIFTPDGRLVATGSDTSLLAPGLYIVGKKAVVVK